MLGDLPYKKRKFLRLRETKHKNVEEEMNISVGQ